MLVDTHCHLGDRAFDADRDEAVARAAAAGVTHIIAIADSVASTEQLDAIAGPAISTTAGVHPHEASSWNDETAARIQEAAQRAAVVAIGETGLDYHYDHSPRDAQRRAFAAQLRLAADLALPVVVHARDADDDMAAMLRDHATPSSPIVLHSFSAGEGVYDTGLEVGAYFGWSGMITFKNWTWQDRVAACPADRILVETDAPYLAPVPHRGRRNEPAFVRLVAEALAHRRGMTLDDVTRVTTENAARCFGSRVAQPQPQTT